MVNTITSSTNNEAPFTYNIDAPNSPSSVLQGRVYTLLNDAYDSLRPWVVSSIKTMACVAAFFIGILHHTSFFLGYTLGMISSQSTTARKIVNDLDDTFKNFTPAEAGAFTVLSFLAAPTFYTLCSMYLGIKSGHYMTPNRTE